MALWKLGFFQEFLENLNVSILVFLDGALKGDVGTCLCKLNEFQSLFFWMALWKPERVKSWPFCTFCFNPCFSGWRSERLQYIQTHTHFSCFNPCFSGWRSERPPGRCELCSYPSFNPCFSGWRSESYVVPKGSWLAYQFQSLFFWMALWKFSNCSRRKPTPTFQSLFFWMALWKKTSLL